MACLMQICAVKGARHTPCLCFQSSLNEVITQAYQRCSLPACGSLTIAGKDLQAKQHDILPAAALQVHQLCKASNHTLQSSMVCCRQSRAVPHCHDMLRMATAGLDSYCPACLLPCAATANTPRHASLQPSHSSHSSQLQKQQRQASGTVVQPALVHQMLLSTQDHEQQRQQQQQQADCIQPAPVQQMHIATQADGLGRRPHANQAVDGQPASALAGSDGRHAEHARLVEGSDRGNTASQMQEPEEALVTAAGGHTELSQASDEQLLAWVSLLSAPDQGSIACATFPSSSGMIDMIV